MPKSKFEQMLEKLALAIAIDLIEAKIIFTSAKTFSATRCIYKKNGLCYQILNC